MRDERRRRAAARRARRRERSEKRRIRASRRASLHALTSSALALPGLAGSAAAESPVDRVRADYAFSYYLEDAIDGSKLAGGDSDRYEIQMHQFHVESPLGDRLDLGLDVTYETMSGATPWYVVPDADGDPIQVMTGATIQEERTDALLSGSLHFDRGALSLSGGFSTENDYLAFNGGVGGDLHFNEKNTTLSGGLGLSIDRIEPTDADDFATRPSSEDKQSYSVFAGLSQVLGEGAVVQTSATFRHSRGYLSDPYKQTLVGGAVLGDSRPDTRNQFSWLTRYRHHFRPLHGSLHLDYRLYADDWEMLSHTAELAWYQSLWDFLRISPSFRYYSQSQAGFYEPFFGSLPGDGYYSSDYRLSPYGAIVYGVKAEILFALLGIDWSAAVSWDRYQSSADLALGSVSVENPGLVSFQLVSVRLTTSF